MKSTSRYHQILVVILVILSLSMSWPLVKHVITEFRCGILDVFLTREKNFTTAIIVKGATMYGSTSIRWIVHTITLKRTYKQQPVEWHLRLLHIL